jgi:hypothetical protein
MAVVKRVYSSFCCLIFGHVEGSGPIREERFDAPMSMFLSGDEGVPLARGVTSIRVCEIRCARCGEDNMLKGRWPKQ